MNKILVLIVCFFLFSSLLKAQSVGKKENDTLINYIDINNKKQGKWIKYYNNNQIKYKGEFLNDIPVGLFTYYFPSGKVKSILNYDDKGNANAEIFWENSNPHAKGTYNAAKQRINTWHIYFEDGTLFAIINYKNGKTDGLVTMYYPGGLAKVFEANYMDGKLEGYYKKYFKGNRLQEEGPCVNGLKHGYWKHYTPEGLIEEEGTYVNGRRHGDWIVYNKDKNKNEPVKYENDIPNNYNELMKEWEDKKEWAKANQDKFKQPEDYFDNPMEFFRDNK